MEFVNFAFGLINGFVITAVVFFVLKLIDRLFT